MNVTDKLSFIKDDKKVIGAGGYFLDRDDGGSMCYSGIWQDGKVIALVLDECCDFDVVRERGEMFVKAVNTHDKLVEALKEALATIDDYLAYEHNGDPWTEDARSMGEMDIDDYEHDGRLERARAALAAAGEQV